MLQKFAMVKYGVFVAKICKHALRASAVRDVWWSPLARQLLPPCVYLLRFGHTSALLLKKNDTKRPFSPSWGI